jgi:two-component system, LytTR family, response regulator
MKVLIIEDEIPAAEKLQRYLLKYDPQMQVLAHLVSVQESVTWLQSHQQEIALIFMDIQLIDGLSFQIFKEVKVDKPVIFTTAFHEFALDAFKVNGIDYLLKPITFMDLSAAMQKLETLRGQLLPDPANWDQLREGLAEKPPRRYKNRFMIKVGEHIRSITADQIALFYAEGRDVYLVTLQNRRFIIDFTLESLEELLDPRDFFRANRTFILNIHAVSDVLVYSNSRLKITSLKEFDKEIIVSREKVAAFKDWFDGG